MDARHTHRCATNFSYWIGCGSEEGCCDYHFMVCTIILAQRALSLRLKRHHRVLEKEQTAGFVYDTRIRHDMIRTRPRRARDSERRRHSKIIVLYKLTMIQRCICAHKDIKLARFISLCLGGWSHDQRARKKNGKLLADKEARLE
jgi:hypothetical protein